MEGAHAGNKPVDPLEFTDAYHFADRFRAEKIVPFVESMKEMRPFRYNHRGEAIRLSSAQDVQIALVNFCDELRQAAGIARKYVGESGVDAFLHEVGRYIGDRLHTASEIAVLRRTVSDKL